MTQAEKDYQDTFKEPDYEGNRLRQKQKEEAEELRICEEGTRKLEAEGC
jgi:hypothetical protein